MKNTVIFCALLFAFSLSAQENYTVADIDLAYRAFNEQFFSPSKGIYYEKSTQRGKVAAIWTQAIFLDVAENVYLRTRNKADGIFFMTVLEGNRRYYDNFNWDNGKVWFIYDDIMWWVVTLARTYLLTGEQQWLERSKSGFERVWSGSKVLKDNGSYDPVAGGMYWAWNQEHPEGTPTPSMGKMACINYPTVIGAMTLFAATGDSAYFRKGLEVYTWARNNLFDKSLGRVADSRHGNGRPAWKMHVYNQATCIGAAVMLYKATGNKVYLDDAILAADYTKNQMSAHEFLHFENGIEQGIYHAIFAQYIIRLIEDGGQSQYLPWLRKNINAGWANRLKTNNITYKDYDNAAPEIEKIESYDASGIPALMQVIPIIDNSSQQFRTNLEGLNSDAGVWTVDERGLISSHLSGDGWVLSNTKAGANFVYEADVQFLNDNESAAALVFGSTNDFGNKNRYVANIHVHNGVTRLFKFQKTGLRGQEAFDLVAQRIVNRSADNNYHLSVTVIGKHIVYSLNGEVVAHTADYTMGSVGGQNDAFTGHYLGLLSWKANCAYQNVHVTEITPDTDPQLSGLSIQTIGGKVEHNVVFDSTQYVSITSVTNETQQIVLNYTKKSPLTNVVVKMGDTVYPDGVAPLQEGNNTVTLECTNGNAKVLYRLIVIRRKAAGLYYNEFDRPQYHWSVKQGWCNDPNGMVYYNGEWHLFHQYYPGIDWGPMHWGHSVSTDLIHWTELPVALYPDEYGTMFSGSAVVDENNTSGLFKNDDGTLSATGGMVLIITADGNGERVTIAYSKDGRHFTKHEGVAIDWTEDPVDDRAFRDPKVFRYQNKWFLVIAGGPLRIYSSDNLLDWTIESVYPHLHTECPDFFPLAVTNGEQGERKWILSRGGVGYKVGDFKPVGGKWTFLPDSHYADSDGIVNYGNDAYATQTYSVGDFDTPQRVIGISWQNFRAPNIGKDNGNKTFNGQMTIQNEWSLCKDANGKYLLRQTPMIEYETLRDTEHAVTWAKQAVNGIVPVDFSGQSYEIVAEFDVTNAKEVGFRVRSGKDYYTKIGYQVAENKFYTDRTRTGTGGYRDNFSQVAPQSAVVAGKLKMRIFVDRNCVEVFGAGNTVTGSTLIYPAVGCDGIEVFSTGNAIVNARIYPMRSIWNEKQSSN